MKTFTLFMALILSASLYAENKSIKIDQFESSDSKRTVSLNLRYQSMANKVIHNEKFNGLNTPAFEKTTEMNNNNLSFELSKELFREQYVSLTLTARYGMGRGTEKGIILDNNTHYKEKLTSK
ncbi:MAG: hypothetical protein KC478_13760, partial [Bacteriovoracaceae bacterium]|nr:hypothetical protein [Bacteriovoracaceae bacterium]